MFSAIGAFFLGLWNALKALVQTIWNVVQQGWTWAVGLIVIIVGCVTEVVTAINNLLSEAVGALSSLVMPQSNVSASGVGNFLAVANHFFPVEEMFALMTAISVVWVIAISYRLIKSWLPTLS
jgi:hypothetical protein